MNSSNKKETETALGIVILLLSLVILYFSARLPMLGYTFFESEAIFPIFISSLMVLLSVIYLFKILRQGDKFNINKFIDSLSIIVTDKTNRRTIYGIIFVGLFAFTFHYLGFYISGFIFMVLMFLFFLHLKILYALFGSIVFISTLYLIFSVIFKIPIK